MILSVRGRRVMLDAALARLYGVPTKALNQAVKRHAERFPDDFVFRLTGQERAQVVTDCDRFARLKHSTALPLVFTEHGAMMAAMLLNSPQAASMSVFVVRAFVRMRERLAANAGILQRLAEIDGTLLEHDEALRSMWAKLQPLLQPAPEPPRRRIGFHSRRAST